MTAACKSCPFRVASPEGYCQDGIDALEDGCVPSCHTRVGRGEQFKDVIPLGGHECVGYELRGTPGYVDIPYLIGVQA